LSDSGWRVVYRLANELARDPERVVLTQRLTLDASMPSMGLKGTFGLFGSEEWWQSINSGRMPLKRISGTITGLANAGMDSHGKINTCVVQTGDGSVHYEHLHVDRPADHSRYKAGVGVKFLYALDEWKDPALLGPEATRGILLETALSRGRAAR
jgi:hypothetical protein